MRPVRYRYSRYRYECRTKVTEVSGTGIDVVPNVPKCPVPVLMSYRYRYRHTVALRYINRRQLIHVPRARDVRRSRQNHRHGLLFRVHIDNLWRRRWHGGWRRRPATRSGGISAGGQLILGVCAVAHACSVSRVPLEDVWGPGCVWLGALPGAKCPRDGVTMCRCWVDVVPKVPRCSVPG